MNMALIQQVSALLKFSHPVRVATVDESSRHHPVNVALELLEQWQR